MSDFDSALDERSSDLLNEIDARIDARLARVLDQPPHQVRRDFIPSLATPPGWSGLTENDGVSLGKIALLAAGIAKETEPEYGLTAEACKAQLEHTLNVFPGDPIVKSMNQATGAAGGFLMPATLQETILKELEAQLIATRAGARMLTGLSGTATWNAEDATADTYWIDTETFEAITETSPTLNAISMRYHPLGSLVKLSYGMLTQSVNAFDSWLKNQLLRKMRLAVDKAFFIGAGSSNEPLGILNATGIGTQTFSSASYTTATSTFPKYLRAMVQTLRANDATIDGEGIAIVAEPRALEAMEAVRDVDGQYLLLDPKRVGIQNVFGVPVFSSSQLASTDSTDLTMLAADFSRLWLGQFGGISLAVNDQESSVFKSGGAWLRALSSWDVAVSEPDAVVEAQDFDYADLP